jgi:hypothetical protein
MNAVPNFGSRCGITQCQERMYGKTLIGQLKAKDEERDL